MADGIRPPKDQTPEWVKEPKGTEQNQHSSLLTLGNSLFAGKMQDWWHQHFYDEYSSARFTLQGINFSSNKAKGGDGIGGGGGGLGAGGGLSVLSGTTHVKDAVFQGLQAIGGIGSDGNHGGKSTELLA